MLSPLQNRENNDKAECRIGGEYPPREPRVSPKRGQRVFRAPHVVRLERGARLAGPIPPAGGPGAARELCARTLAKRARAVLVSKGELLLLERSASSLVVTLHS